MAQRLNVSFPPWCIKPPGGSGYWGRGSWKPRRYRTTLRLPESQLTSQPDLGVIANFYRAHHAFTGMYDWYNCRRNPDEFGEHHYEIILESDRKPDYEP